MRTLQIRKPPSGPVEEVEIPETSSDITNASAVPGATVTAALNALMVGTTLPLSRLLWCDAGTAVPTEAQDGSTNGPFKTFQAAADQAAAVAPADTWAILLVPGTYSANATIVAGAKLCVVGFDKAGTQFTGTLTSFLIGAGCTMAFKSLTIAGSVFVDEGVSLKLDDAQIAAVDGSALVSDNDPVTVLLQNGSRIVDGLNLGETPGSPVVLRDSSCGGDFIVGTAEFYDSSTLFDCTLWGTTLKTIGSEIGGNVVFNNAPEEPGVWTTDAYSFAFFQAHGGGVTGGAPNVLDSAPEVALWATSDSGEIAGYTLSQISDATEYSGAPAVALAITKTANLGILDDGTLLIGDQGNSIWRVLPTALQGLTRSIADTEYRLRSDIDGTRVPVQFSNGDILMVLGGGSAGHRITPRQLYSGLGTGLAITNLNQLGNDLADSHLDASNNLWLSTYDTGVIRFTAATVAAAGAAVADKVASGSNFNGIAGIAFDSSGGLWHSSYDDNVLRYHDSTAIGALTNVTSNPAPTRSITGLTGGLWQIAMDRDGGLWVAVYDDKKLFYFTAAQLLAGGAQAPTRTITSSMVDVNAVRLSSAQGLYLR